MFVEQDFHNLPYDRSRNFNRRIGFFPDTDFQYRDFEKRMKNRVLLFSVLTILSIWIASLAGLFSLIDANLGDLFVRTAPSDASVVSNILLVETDADESPENRERIVENLQKYNPERIVLTEPPNSPAESFISLSRRYPNVVLGRSLRSDAAGAEPSLSPWPLDPGTDVPKFGVAAIPPPSYGIYRTQYAYVNVSGGNYPGLESAAAGLVVSESLPDTFLVNFQAGYGSIPRISSQRALSGDIVPELVAGKYVLIGKKQIPGEPGISTPITPDAPMSRLEFHGYALGTLLSGKTGKTVSAAIALSLIAAVAAVSFSMHCGLSAVLFQWLAFPVAAAYLVAAWGFLVFWNIRLPAVEMLLAHFVASAGFFLRRVNAQEADLRRMAIETSSWLSKRVLPKGFADSSEQWTLAASMVNQTLDLTRTIFLESIEGEKRVKEVAGLHCSLSDIAERRRDFTRTPYKTALEESEPLKLESDFLKPIPDDSGERELQYLVPLRFAGMVMGFWAFGIYPSGKKNIPRFETTIAIFAEQLGELLHRRMRKRRESISRSGREGFFSFQEGKRGYLRDLKQSADLIERRLSLLESAIESGETAIVLFDLFGRVLFINRRMIDLLKGSDLAPFQMTPMDLTMALAGGSADKFRELLRFFIFESDTFTLSAKLPSETDRRFLLHMRRPIPAGGLAEEVRTSPFKSSGILFELVEVTDIAKAGEYKDAFLSSVTTGLRRDLEPIVLAADLLAEEKLPSRLKASCSEILKRRVADMISLVQNAGNELAKENFHTLDERYPLDPTEPLKKAVEALAPEVAGRRLEIEIEAPESKSLVCAGPNALVDVFKAILSVLVGDAATDTKIKIDVINTDDGIIFTFANKGFGIPNAAFQRYLFERDEVGTPEFRRLRRAVVQARQWGADIRASSEVGEGMRFTLHFETGTCNWNWER